MVWKAKWNELVGVHAFGPYLFRSIAQNKAQESGVQVCTCDEFLWESKNTWDDVETCALTTDNSKNLRPLFGLFDLWDFMQILRNHSIKASSRLFQIKITPENHSNFTRWRTASVLTFVIYVIALQSQENQESLYHYCINVKNGSVKMNLAQFQIKCAFHKPFLTFWILYPFTRWLALVCLEFNDDKRSVRFIHMFPLQQMPKPH